MAVPNVTPATTPDELTVAMPVALELHVPPGVLLLNVVEPDGHIVAAPVMGETEVTTVTVAVPIIGAVQAVAALVATTEYVPDVLNVPKLNAPPVPETGEPIGEVPM